MVEVGPITGTSSIHELIEGNDSVSDLRSTPTKRFGDSSSHYSCRSVHCPGVWEYLEETSSIGHELAVTSLLEVELFSEGWPYKGDAILLT